MQVCPQCSEDALKIVLIVPPAAYVAERWQHGSLMPPLGIGYVAAVLEREGLEVQIIDAQVERLSRRKLLARVRNAGADIAGLTFTTENRFDAFKTMKLLRESFPDLTIVAGGPHASLAAEDSLKHIDALDIVVRGEGEYSTLKLMKVLREKEDLGEVPGISFRMNGEVVHNSPHRFIESLDSLPFPARHLFPYEKYNFVLDVPGEGKLPAANMMTSRGCPFNCNFCATPVNWGKRCRFRSPENILEEIEQLIKDYRVCAIWIFDDTFTVDKARTEKFCSLLMERNLKIHWFCEIRADKNIDRELLSMMKKSGCFSVGFGVESGSQRILDEVVGKKIQLGHVDRIRSWCDELGIITNPFFIFSHPTEQWSEALQTLEFMRRFRSPHRSTVALLHVYPGTRLERLAREKGILPQDFSWTDERVPGVRTLPAAQGNVPLFIDKLTWSQISDLIFAWAEDQKVPVIKKIPHALKSIRSWQDIVNYLVMMKSFLKRRKAQTRALSSEGGKVKGDG